MTTSARYFKAPRPPAPAKPFSGTLGVVAIAFGLGIAGALALDLHAHTCCRCGHRWRHFGAFNLGDATAHRCSRCGAEQWWKDGFSPTTAPARTPMDAASAMKARLDERVRSLTARSQEFRALHRPALLSGTMEARR